MRHVESCAVLRWPYGTVGLAPVQLLWHRFGVSPKAGCANRLRRPEDQPVTPGHEDIGLLHPQVSMCEASTQTGDLRQLILATSYVVHFSRTHDRSEGRRESFADHANFPKVVSDTLQELQNINQRSESEHAY